MTNAPVLAKECKFAIHIPANYRNGTEDYHMVKEAIHNPNGTTTPNLRLIRNFKRPFWITAPSKRFNKEKIEWESIDNLQKHECTQSELRNGIAKALECQWSKDTYKKLTNSPYVYGSDISSTSLIKERYRNAFPNTESRYSLAVLDIETDVVRGTKDILIITVSMVDRIFTAILPVFLEGIADVNTLLTSKASQYIGEYLEKRNMCPEIYIADSQTDMIRAVFDKLHIWKPDLLAAWNMDFDIPRILEALETSGVDPKDILSDPSIPKDLRICKYRQGAQKKVTASSCSPINPADQWHSVTLTASFYIIDAMCSYKRIREGEQDEGSYSLDAILHKELGIRKLKFKEADEYDGLKWHFVMQSQYKLEYVIYNLFDCISMLELDEKTKDLGFTLPTYAGITDFAKFKSQPQKIADQLEVFLQRRGYVYGTVGDSYNAVEDDGADSTLGLEDWILTLPAHMCELGMNCIVEDPTMRTGIRCHTYDSDAVKAYPSAVSVANVSKGTTRREIIRIDGIDESVFREQNLNFVIGYNNSIQYCTTMLSLPGPEELLKKIS